MNMIRFVAVAAFVNASIIAASAQSKADEVIKAELDFAKMAKDKSTKQAFLENLSPTAILYSQGDIVNGRELWSGRAEDNSLLAWWPVFADISLDNDLGYTTGPFQFFNARGDKEAVSTGYYSTIWKKGADGIWRVMTDIGISLREPVTFPHDISVADEKGERQAGATIHDDFVSFEKQYISRLNATKASFDAGFLADQFRIHRNVIGPVTSAAQLEKLSGSMVEYRFEYVASGVSSAGDLAYAYGKVKVNKKDNAADVRALNYLRVWKRLNGQWRIVLDVIGG